MRVQALKDKMPAEEVLLLFRSTWQERQARSSRRGGQIFATLREQRAAIASFLGDCSIQDSEEFQEDQGQALPKCQCLRQGEAYVKVPPWT